MIISVSRMRYANHQAVTMAAGRSMSQKVHGFIAEQCTRRTPVVLVKSFDGREGE
jgi:hypothetical protein